MRFAKEKLFFFFELRQSLAVFGLVNGGCAYAFCGESLQPPAAAGAFAATAAGLRRIPLCVALTGAFIRCLMAKNRGQATFSTLLGHRSGQNFSIRWIGSATD